VWIDDEFLGRAPIEIVVTLRSLFELDDGGVHRFRDLNFVIQYRLHQLPVVPKHRALASCEAP